MKSSRRPPLNFGLMCLRCGARGAAEQIGDHNCPATQTRMLEALCAAAFVLLVVVTLIR